MCPVPNTAIPSAIFTLNETRSPQTEPNREPEKKHEEDVKFTVPES
jgi:hypothetical protein